MGVAAVYLAESFTRSKGIYITDSKLALDWFGSLRLNALATDRAISRRS